MSCSTFTTTLTLKRQAITLRRSDLARYAGSADHSLYLIKLFGPGYPEGNFGGGQPLDGSISLSLHKPMYDERFARQYRCEPPSEFLLSLPFTGIARRPSGPSIYAHTQTLLS